MYFLKSSHRNVFMYMMGFINVSEQDNMEMDQEKRGMNRSECKESCKQTLNAEGKMQCYRYCNTLG